MSHYSYRTSGVCSTRVEFDINEGKVSGVQFTGGCSGNLSAISKLTEGMDASRVIEILEGNTCGFKKTSCADQFAKALRSAMESEN